MIYHLTCQNGYYQKDKKKQVLKKITSVGEDVDKRDLSCTVSGDVSCCSHYGKRYGSSPKIKNRAMEWSRNSTSGYFPKENKKTNF